MAWRLIERLADTRKNSTISIEGVNAAIITGVNVFINLLA